MSQNSAEVRIAGNGGLFLAPLGSALPTSPTATLDAAFVDLGYFSEDGVTVSPERTIEKFRAWQSRKPVRQSITAEDITIGGSLLQWNNETIPVFFGGGTVTETTGPPDYWTYTPPASGTIDERAMVLEWQDGLYTYRLVAARTVNGELGEITLTGTALGELPINVEILEPSGGGDSWELITDDPAFGQ